MHHIKCWWCRITKSLLLLLVLFHYVRAVSVHSKRECIHVNDLNDVCVMYKTPPHPSSTFHDDLVTFLGNWYVGDEERNAQTISSRSFVEKNGSEDGREGGMGNEQKRRRLSFQDMYCSPTQTFTDCFTDLCIDSSGNCICSRLMLYNTPYQEGEIPGELLTRCTTMNRFNFRNAGFNGSIPSEWLVDVSARVNTVYVLVPIS